MSRSVTVTKADEEGDDFISASQRKLAHLARALSDTSEAVLERRIQALEERKLLFRDGELYLSLVVGGAIGSLCIDVEEHLTPASIRVE